MFLSTRGIVFRQIKYSDTSLVVKIMTEQSGIRTYIIKGARGPRAKIRGSLFQPLNLLDLVVSHNEKSELHHIREARVSYLYESIPADIRKSSILLFLNELLYKSIQEEVVNPELFKFLFDHLVLLDQTIENPANFHLVFMLNMTRYLGFFPQGQYLDENSVFDLSEGLYVQSPSLTTVENSISGEACRWFRKMSGMAVTEFGALQIPHAIRNELLEKMISYYQYHLPLSGTFKSHLVLHAIFK